ncbi:hypothetical protein JOD54_004528 [Actinokineospora baliensis]|uniref:hypothetical protein n=1 Tax=Actinokineospora baliensis TaxID=547056 RepID=UPI00195817FE|nr:hypothetical protein [Actinokineospora baliensis]MBM7774324.1 hypothetical protein [Actinokineospora baliensis]
MDFEVESADGERWALRLRTTGPPLGQVEGTRTSVDGPDHPVRGEYKLRPVPGLKPIELELRLDGHQWVLRCALTPQLAELSLVGVGTCRSEDDSQKVEVRCKILPVSAAVVYDLFRSLTTRDDRNES